MDARSPGDTNGDIVQGFLDKYENLKRRGQLEPILRGVEIRAQRPPEIEEVYALRDAYHALRTFHAFEEGNTNHERIEDLKKAGKQIEKFTKSLKLDLANQLVTTPQKVRLATALIDELLPRRAAFYTSKPNRLLGANAAETYFNGPEWLERRGRDRSTATDNALKRLAPVFDMFASVPFDRSSNARKLAKSLSEHLVKAGNANPITAEYDFEALKAGKSDTAMLMLGEYVWGFCAYYLTWRKPRKSEEIPVKPEIEEMLALRAMMMELRHVEVFSKELQVRAESQRTAEAESRLKWAFIAGVVLRQFVRELINEHKTTSGFYIDSHRRIRLPGEIPKIARQAAELLHMLLPRLGYSVNRIPASNAKEGKEWGAQVAKQYLSTANVEMRKKDRSEAEIRAVSTYDWPPLDFWKQQH